MRYFNLASAFAVVAMGLPGCSQRNFQELVEIDGESCWELRPRGPRGIDLDSCNKNAESSLAVIDPEGDCWSIEYCDLTDETWDGWRHTIKPDDQWCIDEMVGVVYSPVCGLR